MSACRIEFSNGKRAAEWGRRVCGYASIARGSGIAVYVQAPLAAQLEPNAAHYLIRALCRAATG